MLVIISKLVQAFWSIFPDNFYVLITISAVCEAISTYLFKVSESRGWLSFMAYVFGILVVGFYGEALRYSKLGQSYPIWLALVALFISISSVFILKENLKFGVWIAGFALVIAGISIIQLSLPPEQ